MNSPFGSIGAGLALRRLPGVCHFCSDRVTHPMYGVVNVRLKQHYPRRKACALLSVRDEPDGGGGADSNPRRREK